MRPMFIGYLVLIAVGLTYLLTVSLVHG